MDYMIKRKVGRKFVDFKAISLQGDHANHAIGALVTAGACGDHEAGHLCYVFKHNSGQLDIGYDDDFTGRAVILYKLVPVTA
jgi:hypothetical protein